MADSKHKKRGEAKGHKDMASWKPGSEPGQAKDVAGKGDFGVPASGGVSNVDREYTSENTRRSDPGAAHPFAWEHEGVRDHGAGAPDGGPGSNSGGDLDTDVIGFGPDAGPPEDRRPHKVGGNKRVAGTTFSSGGDDVTSNGSAEGADAATSPLARGDDDSFEGEVSTGEADGQDLGMPPSSDTQGLLESDAEASGQKEFPDTDSD